MRKYRLAWIRSASSPTGDEADERVPFSLPGFAAEAVHLPHRPTGNSHFPSGHSLFRGISVPGSRNKIPCSEVLRIRHKLLGCLAKMGRAGALEHAGIREIRCYFPVK